MPGQIAQVIGTVVDVEFPADQLPNLFDALEVDNSGERLVLEVQQHIGNHWARCLALGSTDGLARGSEVTDTGNKVAVPVGDETWGASSTSPAPRWTTSARWKPPSPGPIHRDPAGL